MHPIARLSRLYNARRSRGASFVEALIFVTVIGLIAVVALPNLSSSRGGQVDLVASEIAEALRFARVESMRTGDVFGVTVDKDTERVIVFKAKMSPLPIAPEYTVYHPIRKQLWDVSFGSNPSTASVDVANASGPFEYVGLGAQPTVLFNARGQPFGVNTASGAIYRLDDSTNLLLNSPSGIQLQLQLDPINGRVSLD